jgi:hypothetical protein
MKNMTPKSSESAQRNGGALKERGRRRSALGKSDRAMTGLSEKTEQHNQLVAGEAFQLYVRRIDHNLTTLLEQLMPLRAIVNGEQESPAEIRDLCDNRGRGHSEGR